MTPEAPLIHKEVLRDKIFEVLKTWILNGTLKPGERIVEYTLAAKLQVSRAPLREALWLLSHRGLVTLKAHQGAFVTQLSDQDLREILEVREALETYAAKKVHAKLTPDKSARLRRALDDLEAAARRRDVARFNEADLAFHRTLAALSENRHIEETLQDLSTRFFGYELIRDLPHGDLLRFEDVAGDHRRMVELILKGDEANIEEGFKKIFAGFVDHLLDRFRRQEQGPRSRYPAGGKP